MRTDQQIEDGVRRKMISEIDSLYPPDQHPEGEQLLLKALASAWRDLPTDVIRELWHQCRAKDRAG